MSHQETLLLCAFIHISLPLSVEEDVHTVPQVSLRNLRMNCGHEMTSGQTPISMTVEQTLFSNVKNELVLLLFDPNCPLLLQLHSLFKL